MPTHRIENPNILALHGLALRGNAYFGSLILLSGKPLKKTQLQILFESGKN